MSAMIQVRGLVKRFSGRTAVAGLDLEVQRGEVVTLLGANGAGKSTVLRTLAGTTVPDEGDVRVAGVDVVRERRRAAAAVGAVLATEVAWYLRLSGRANLEFFGAMQGMGLRDSREAAARELASAGLEPQADVRVAAYSRGMRARLALARARLADPPVLLLDEPSAALDGHSERELLDTLRAEHGRRAVVLATHLVSEVTAVADRALVLAGGRVAAELVRPFDEAAVTRALTAAEAAGQP